MQPFDVFIPSGRAARRRCGQSASAKPINRDLPCGLAPNNGLPSSATTVKEGVILLGAQVALKVGYVWMDAAKQMRAVRVRRETGKGDQPQPSGYFLQSGVVGAKTVFNLLYIIAVFLGRPCRRALSLACSIQEDYTRAYHFLRTCDGVVRVSSRLALAFTSASRCSDAAQVRQHGIADHFSLQARGPWSSRPSPSRRLRKANASRVHKRK